LLLLLLLLCCVLLLVVVGWACAFCAVDFLGRVACTAKSSNANHLARCALTSLPLIPHNLKTTKKGL
jgi:hypothetical protein